MTRRSISTRSFRHLIPALMLLCGLLPLLSHADDSEIFYGGASTVGPNVLFIVDTSGSMSQTIPGSTFGGSGGGAYAGTTTYTGACGANTVYFVSGNTTPSASTCTSAPSTTSFQCSKGATALTSLGSYVDSFIEYGGTAWTNTISGQTAKDVACYGDAAGAAASAGNGKGLPVGTGQAYFGGGGKTNCTATGEWTTTAASDYWSCNNTGRAYTAYLGNYVNYLTSKALAANPYVPTTNYISQTTKSGCTANTVYFYSAAASPDQVSGCNTTATNPILYSTSKFQCTLGLTAFTTKGSYGDSFAAYYKATGTTVYQWSNTLSSGVDVACASDFTNTAVVSAQQAGNGNGYPATGTSTSATGSEWTTNVGSVWFSGTSTGNSGTTLVAYSANYLAYLYVNATANGGGGNGSTNEQTKIVVAVQALKALIPLLPTNWNVGLMTYNYISTAPSSPGTSSGAPGVAVAQSPAPSTTCGNYGNGARLGNGTLGYGGCVVVPFLPLSNPANVTTLVNAISNFTATGDTPLVGSQYEAYLYFQGLNQYFGAYANNGACMSSGSNVPSASNNYLTPVNAANASCQKNFSILVTDGLPNESSSYSSLIGALPGINTTGLCSDGPYLPLSSACQAQGGSAVNGGTCLSSLTNYMAHNAKNPVQTYFLAFGADSCLVQGFNYLQRAATAGGGQAYQVTSADTLLTTLNQISTQVLQITTSFTAPTVPVNAFNRTQTLNDLYISMFEPNADYHWAGNLKHYTLATAGTNAGNLIDANGNLAVNPSTGFITASADSAFAGEPVTTADGTSSQAAPNWPDGSNVNLGGAAMLLPCWQQRYLFTYTGAAPAAPVTLGTVPASQVAGTPVTGCTSTGVGLTSTSATQLTVASSLVTGTNAAAAPALVGIPATDTTTKVANVINFALGADLYNAQGTNTSTNTGTRLTMGDSLHGQPAFVFYGQDCGSTTCVSTNTTSTNAYVFTTDNDGFLHAFQAYTGQEAWSFIPAEFLPSLYNLYTDPNYPGPPKHYTLDGSVQVLKYDVNGDGVIEPEQGDRVILYFGDGRGGNNYYALDVTNPLAPQYLWSIGPSQLPNIGNTWSTPVIAKVATNQTQSSNQKLVLIFGGGYDPGEDIGWNAGDTVGHGIYMVDAVSGALLWAAGLDSTSCSSSACQTFPAMTHAFPSGVAVLDTNGDGYADRLYAADLGGQVWRFDITNQINGANFGVTGGVIASLGGKIGGASVANERRFYNAPDIALIQATGQPSYFNLAIGSGYRGHPLAVGTNDRMYAIRDYFPFTPLNQTAYAALSIAVDATAGSGTGYLPLVDITAAASSGATPVVPANSAGWQFDLGGGVSDANGEKVLSAASTFNNNVLFTTYTPAASANAAASCSPPQIGTNNFYDLQVVTGAATSALNGQTHVALQQAGIAPPPTFLFPPAAVTTGGVTYTGTLGSIAPVGSGGSTAASGKQINLVCTAGVEVLKVCKSFNTVVKTYWTESDAK